MSNKLPSEVQKCIKEIVYRKADEHGYAKRNRIDNGAFLDNLVQDPDVGLKISQYISRQDVRTYIKDAILNRYSKDKAAELLNGDPVEIAKKIMGIGAILIETKVVKYSKVHLLKLENNDYLILSEGTILKWETALKKALEFVAQSPGLPPTRSNLYIGMNLVSAGSTITSSDKIHIERSLRLINVKVFFNS